MEEPLQPQLLGVTSRDHHDLDAAGGKEQLGNLDGCADGLIGLFDGPQNCV